MQNASVLDILNGTDVLVKAKTGTGKTLGFLIPAIDLLIHEKIRVAQVQRAAAREGKYLHLVHTYIHTYIHTQTFVHKYITICIHKYMLLRN